MGLHASPPLLRCSSPQLTELSLQVVTGDAELEALLSGCPQLLVLDCAVTESWKAVVLAARCCPRLLELTVKRVTKHVDDPQEVREDDVAAFDADFSGPFLPDLIALKLLQRGGELDSRRPRGFPVIRYLTASPHAELRLVRMQSPDVTAEDVMSLAGLPGLSHLHAINGGREGGSIAKVEEAHVRAQQQLLSRGAAGGDADHDAHFPVQLEDRDFDVWFPPLGPHQQQEMKQRVLQGVEEYNDGNLLAIAEGVDRETARSVFFAELRSVLTATVSMAGAEGGA